MSLIPEFWTVLAVEETDFDFYSTAAQVIPLIFVALAFEFRGKGGQFLPPDLLPKGGTGPDQSDIDAAEATPRGRAILRWAAIYTVVMTVVLAAGEVVALHVIAYDNPWRGSQLAVGSSLTIGALGIIVPIAIQQLNVVTRLRRLEPREPVAARGKRRLRREPREQRTREADEAVIENVPRAAFQWVAILTAILGALGALIPPVLELLR